MRCIAPKHVTSIAGCSAYYCTCVNVEAVTSHLHTVSRFDRSGIELQQRLIAHKARTLKQKQVFSRPTLERYSCINKEFLWFRIGKNRNHQIFLLMQGYLSNVKLVNPCPLVLLYLLVHRGRVKLGILNLRALWK